MIEILIAALSILAAVITYGFLEKSTLALSEVLAPKATCVAVDQSVGLSALQLDPLTGKTAIQTSAPCLDLPQLIDSTFALSIRRLIDPSSRIPPQSVPR